MAGTSFGTLYSGSCGNCSFFTHNGTVLLVDAGKNRKCLTASLVKNGLDPSDVRGIFITHMHGDHTGALRVFTKSYCVPVYAAPDAAGQLCDICTGDTVKVCPRPADINIDGIRVTSFRTSHDSPGASGYIFEADGCRYGYMTDTGYVTDEARAALRGCRSVILESNHDPYMLRNGSYPPDTKARILSDFGHLSNEACAEFAVFLAQNGTKSILLAHISEHNNTPQLALGATGQALADAGFTPVQAGTPERNGCVALGIAFPDMPVTIYSET